MHNRAYLQSAKIGSNGSMIQTPKDVICREPVEFSSQLDVPSFLILAVTQT